MINITDLQQEEKKPPIFRLAFRPFFLFGSLFSVVAISVWALFLMNPAIQWQPVGGWFWWHGHEMLYGFCVAIIAGFLLTAVQNWSGIPGLSGWPLAALFLLWALTRLLMLFPVLPVPAISILDTLFLPVAAIILARPIIAAKLWKNLMFIPLLLLLAWANGLNHYRLYQGELLSLPETIDTILIITLIIMLMGGRVIPFFTVNALNLKFKSQNQAPVEKPQPVLVIELLAIIPLLLVILQSLTSRDLGPEWLLGALFLISAAANIVRLARWRGALTLDNPLLWSLHLSYLLIALSLGLMGLYHMGINIPLTSALHGLTIGGMGLMILAMISRVSLGHTGRPLKVGRWITLGFVAIATATLVRVFAPLLSHQLNTWYIVGSICWVFAYTTFVLVYWPVLTKPRADGRPG
jgi:uncharacterized protein involved in response to NO